MFLSNKLVEREREREKMLEAVNSSNRLSLIKSYLSRSNVQPSCLRFRLLLLKEQVRSSMQRSLELFYSLRSPSPFSPIDYTRVCFVDSRKGFPPPEVPLSTSHDKASSLNLSASVCPNHASIDLVAPLTRPKGNVISRERGEKARFFPSPHKYYIYIYRR